MSRQSFHYPLELFGDDIPYVSFIAKELKPGTKDLLSLSDASESNSTVIGGITLPMPNSLGETINHNFNQDGSILSDVMEAASSTKIGKAIQKGATSFGTITDPKLTQVYNGTGLREWSCSFTFIPQSKAESDMVQDIIKNFKLWSAPERVAGGAMLKSPYFFQIKFSNDVLQKNMKFDAMALTSFAVEHFAQGYPSTFHDGSSKMMQINMSFAEYGVKTRKDWK